jgi:hypothetical protein
MSYLATEGADVQSLSYPLRLKATPAAIPAPADVLRKSLLLITLFDL